MFIAVFPLKRIRRGKLLLGNILITMSIIFAKQISFCVAVPAIQAKERKLYRVGSNPHIVSRNKSIEQRWRKSSNDILKENANDINESRLIPKKRQKSIGAKKPRRNLLECRSSTLIDAQKKEWV